MRDRDDMDLEDGEHNFDYADVDPSVRRRGRGFGAGASGSDVDGLRSAHFERVDGGDADSHERAARCKSQTVRG